MIAQKIKYKGITRAASDQEIQDGWLDELINLKYSFFSVRWHRFKPASGTVFDQRRKH
jgi:hypothetical protein